MVTREAVKTIQINKPEYTLDPPTIYESQLFPEGFTCGQGTSFIDLCQSMIICFSGSRGAGKTLSLVYAAAKALAIGHRVWLNFPMEFYLLRDVSDPDNAERKREKLTAQLFDLKAFLVGKEDYSGGLIGLDEYQDIASAYAFSSTKNRLLAAMWAQIRKRRLSFYYTSKFYEWVDTRTRAELDVEMECQDAQRTPWGRKRYGRGEMVFWQMKDWSGMVTGYQFQMTGTKLPFKFFSRPFWGAYPTEFRIDIFESLRGIELDLQKDVISDRPEEQAVNYNELVPVALNLFQQQSQWRPADLWLELRIRKLRDKTNMKQVLRKVLGLREKSALGQVWFVIDDNPPKSATAA